MQIMWICSVTWGVKCKSDFHFPVRKWRLKCRRCSFPIKNANWLWLSLASRSCYVHVVAARSVRGENGGIRQCRWRHLFMQELWAHMELVRPFQDMTDVWCRLPFFFSGSLASKVLRFLDIFWNWAHCKIHAFWALKMFLHATVHSVWKNEQNKNLQMLRGRGGHLVLERDGGWDSPGHSAKQGGYNMLDCVTKRVVDVQVVRVCNRIVTCF